MSFVVIGFGVWKVEQERGVETKRVSASGDSVMFMWVESTDCHARHGAAA